MSVLHAIENAAMALERENVRAKMCLELGYGEYTALRHELGPLLILVDTGTKATGQVVTIKLAIGNTDVFVTRDTRRP